MNMQIKTLMMYENVDIVSVITLENDKRQEYGVLNLVCDGCSITTVPPLTVTKIGVFLTFGNVATNVLFEREIYCLSN